MHSPSTHPYPPQKIFPIHSCPPKIFSQPFTPTQHNAPTTPNHPKDSSSHPAYQKYSSANLICSTIQNSSLPNHMALWLWGQVTSQTRNICPHPQGVWPSNLVGGWLKLFKCIFVNFAETQFRSTFNWINIHGLAKSTCYWFIL